VILRRAQSDLDGIADHVLRSPDQADRPAVRCGSPNPR
jgi:plasmid stabilization system protein ParE